MADDKTMRGGADRRRIAAGQQYEVKYFAAKHRLSFSDAREVLRKAGTSRDKANELAAKRER